MLAPLSNYWRGAWPPWSPLFLRLCIGTDKTDPDWTAQIIADTNQGLHCVSFHLQLLYTLCIVKQAPFVIMTAADDIY